MEHSDSCGRAWRLPPPRHHHHHHHLHFYHFHHHHLIFCPLHHHRHLNSHSLVNFNFARHCPQYLKPVPLQLQNSENGTPMLQELEHRGLEEAAGEEEDDDDDDEPIFVLTDEWRDFFAASEAKRKLEKKKAKTGEQK